nr:hypothetical protein [Desulforamulus ferrireducens]
MIGLDMGANDYITKPFRIRELLIPRGSRQKYSIAFAIYTGNPLMVTPPWGSIYNYYFCNFSYCTANNVN